MVTVLVLGLVMVAPPPATGLNVPLVTVIVVVNMAAGPSTSLTLMALPLAAENTCGVSSGVVCAGGTVFTGASGVAVTVKPSVEVSMPPRPSLTV